MALKKCPRCELNYILDGGAYCTVCRREIKGDHDNDHTFELCSVCNENPALPGKDMCLFCLKEMKGAEQDALEPDVSENTLEIDGVSNMEEIAGEVEDDIPDQELSEIDRELSLDDVLDEENEGDDDLDGDGEEAL